MKSKKIYLILIAVVVAAGLIGWGVFQGIHPQSGVQAINTAQTIGKDIKKASERVILKVNDQEATERDWVWEYVNLRYNPALSSKGDQELKVEALARLIEDKVLLSEALKRGFGVSEEEAKSYTEKVRENVDSPNISQASKQFFEEFLQALGLSEEKYWEQIALRNYKAILTVTRLKENLRGTIPPPTEEEIQAWEEKHPNYQNAPQEVLQQEVAREKFDQFFNAFENEIAQKAKVEVLDPQLQELLPQALKLIEQGLEPIPIPTPSP